MWSTSLALGPVKGSEVELGKETERYLLAGCVAEMSFVKLPYTQDDACDTYATVCFQGEDRERVYAAAIKAGVPSLQKHALCGDGTADTTLGAMGMSYPAFLLKKPHSRTPPTGVSAYH